MLREAEQPILLDLAAAGRQVESVWDLVNTVEPYYESLPVLLHHFERGGYPGGVVESLGRALAVRPSVEHGDRFVEILVHGSSDAQRAVAAVILAACATKAQVDHLVHLVGMPELGENRILLLRPLRRLDRILSALFEI